MDKIDLVGFWNGSTDEPVIKFALHEIPELQDWPMVHISMSILPESIATFSKMDKVSSGLKGLEQSAKRLTNLLRSK